MRRSTGISAFLSLFRAGSASAIALATILSCSDSTAPELRMPYGVHSIDVVVPDSLKGFWLSTSSTLLTAPVDVSANVLTPPAAAYSSSVGAFKYAVSHVPFEVEAIPGVIIPQDSLKDDGYLTDVPLGFSFDFYGATYDKVNVYSNGFLQFGVPQIDKYGLLMGGFIKSSQMK